LSGNVISINFEQLESGPYLSVAERIEHEYEETLHGTKCFTITNARIYISIDQFNPLMGTLKSQSNGPLYSNTVIGTLAVDGWPVTFGTAMKGLGGLNG